MPSARWPRPASTRMCNRNRWRRARPISSMWSRRWRKPRSRSARWSRCATRSCRPTKKSCACRSDRRDFPAATYRQRMTGPEVMDVARDAIVTLVLVSSPLMLIGLIVGVVISLFQALTQIQEMTLVFVPKILAIFLAMLVALRFVADTLQGYMTRLAARIVAGG